MKHVRRNTTVSGWLESARLMNTYTMPKEFFFKSHVVNWHRPADFVPYNSFDDTVLAIGLPFGKTVTNYLIIVRKSRQFLPICLLFVSIKVLCLLK